jgi:hypothetical protein
VIRPLLVFLLLTGSAAAQPRSPIPPDTLAEVGASVITARDLIERIELMPWGGKEGAGQRDSIKIHALQSLVAEHLLALDANALGLGRDSATAINLRTLERLLVRDQLYRDEVLPKAIPTKAELQEGQKRSQWTLKLLLLTSRTREDARQVYRLLSRTTLDSTLEHLPTGLLERADTLSINFGDVEEPLEDASYSLSASQRISRPLLVRPLGWVVVALLSKTPQRRFLDLSIPDRFREVEEKLRQRKETEIAEKFEGSILSVKRAEAIPEAFELFSSTALRILRSDSTRYRLRGRYSLAVILDTLGAVLGARLDSPMVRMDRGALLFQDILEGYRYLPFSFPTLDETDFTLRLNGSIKQIAATEYLAREGYRQHLQNSQAVRHDLATWANYWSARAVERELKDSATVTDGAVMEYLVENGGILGRPYEVNVREVLSDSLPNAIQIFEQAANGADLASLAKAHSKRKEWAARGGESLWFRVSGFPDIGFPALAADSGQLVGPLKLAHGYSVFRVLGKRMAPGDSLIPFDSLRTLIRARLRNNARLRQLDRRIVEDARTYGAKIYYDRLRKLEITPQNMVTRRMIGFGGVMVAVPTLLPRWEWVKQAEGLRDVLP